MRAHIWGTFMCVCAAFHLSAFYHDNFQKRASINLKVLQLLDWITKLISESISKLSLNQISANHKILNFSYEFLICSQAFNCVSSSSK